MFRFLFTTIHKLRRCWKWLLQQEGTPAKRARGIAVGVFTGCFPFFGFQTLLGIFLARLVRGNHLLAVFGTWISNPFTYVPIYWFNYRIGSYLIGRGTTEGEFVGFSTHALWNQSWTFTSRVILGSSFVGVACGTFTGFLLYLILKIRSDRYK